MNKFEPTEITIDNSKAYVVPFNNAYAINEYSEVFSNKSGEWLKLSTPICAKTGYKMVCLTFNGEKQLQRTYAVHRLLFMSAVCGEIDRKNVIDHIDGNRTNNDLSNLQLLSFADNIRKGSRAKITAETAKKIALDIQSGKETLTEIAKIYGVSFNCIFAIKEGATWSDVTGIPKKPKKNYYIKKETLSIRKKRQVLDILKKAQKNFDKALAIIEELKAKSNG